jgi:hypothetical protein
LGLVWPLRGLKLKEMKVLIIGSSGNLWHGDTPLGERSWVTTRIRCILGQPNGPRGYAYSDNSIHLRCSNSHQLRTGEISCVESIVIFRVKGRTVLSLLDILDKGIEQRIMFLCWTDWTKIISAIDRVDRCGGWL